MSRIVALSSTLSAALALGGCCNGPFVYVDCVASSITISAVDAAGDPAAVDEVIWRLDGGPAEVAYCRGGDTGGACASFLIPADRDGTVEIELFVGGVVVGTETVEVVHPDARPGECCGDVFTEEREVVLSS